MKRLYILWMGILLILAATHTRAQVVFNATNFPDANFRAYLKEVYGFLGFTTEGVVISAENLKNIIGINCAQRSIGSIKGVEYFPELMNIGCQQNNIKEIDMSKNIKLNHLFCFENPELTTLKLPATSTLTQVYCQDGKLTSLDVSKNPNLLHLFCHGNLITNIDLSKNKELLKFHIGGNRISRIDVSNNTKLDELGIQGHNISGTLDLSRHTKLVLLYAFDNAFTSIKLPTSNTLEILYVNNNRLKTLDLSRCSKLTELGVGWQTSTDDLFILSNTKVAIPRDADGVAVNYTNMSLDGTGKTMISETMDGVNYQVMSGMTYAQVMALLNGSHSVKYYYNTKCATPAFANTLMDVTLTTTPYVAVSSGNFPDANFRTAVGTFSGANDKKFTLAELNAITNINVGRKNIASLNGLEYFTKLQVLDCSYNSLTALNPDYHPSLRTVSCQGNQLVNMTFNQSKASLQYLYCMNNKFTGLNFTDFNALNTLDCYSQQNASLTKLTLPSGSGNALAILNCQENSLTGGLDASKNMNLTSLYTYNNPNLGSLKLPTTKTLKSLWCYNNGLSGTLDVSYYTNMESLLCNNNELTELKLPNTTTLWRLHTNYNKLTTLDVTKNTGLTNLWCHYNRLRTLDLSKNATLTTLNCANQASTEDVSVFDYSKIGIYLPSGGKKDNFVDMQVAGAAQAADVLANSGKQYLVVNPTPTGDVDLYDKTVTYGYKTECASPNFPNATMTGVTVTTYPYVMWVNPNSKSVSGNYYSGTIVLDYDAVVPAGTEVYVITGLKATPRDMMYDGTKYSMQQFNMQRIAVAGQVVPKNTPVYVKSDTQDGLFAFGRNTANATPVAVPSGNLLKGSATAAITGFEPYSILTLGREQKTREVGFWQYSGTSSAKNRCYLEASILEGTNGAKGAVFSFDDEENQVTSIDETSLKANDQRFNDSWYTLDGRKIVNGTLPKGIYIHNGRKEVVR
ncbi:MAG: hypothetical protein ILA04_05735 [Prevotella sp.]|nr:hypothetical protein [Prevotella sp.]